MSGRRDLAWATCLAMHSVLQNNALTSVERRAVSSDDGGNGAAAQFWEMNLADRESRESLKQGSHSDTGNGLRWTTFGVDIQRNYARIYLRARLHLPSNVLLQMRFKVTGQIFSTRSHCPKPLLLICCMDRDGGARQTLHYMDFLLKDIKVWDMWNIFRIWINFPPSSQLIWHISSLSWFIWNNWGRFLWTSEDSLSGTLTFLHHKNIF